MEPEILKFTTGVLKMYVSSNGDMIPAGTRVNIYRVQEGKDLYVKVCSDKKHVYLPFYGTMEEDLLVDEYPPVSVSGF